MKTIQSLDDFKQFINENDAVLGYFSHEKCNVCKTLKPKLVNHFKAHFPKFELAYSDVEINPELAAHYSVFTVPVIVIFFEGKEFIRKARSFGIGELSELINRPYELMFN